MSRSWARIFATRIGFPRVSGDEPLTDDSGGDAPQFSPRERG